jgi:hypothetical protein
LNLISTQKIKFSLKGWKQKDFEEQVEKQYIEMNEAFSAGNIEKLKDLVTTGLFLELHSEMKKTKDIGAVKWEHSGSVKRPKLLQLLLAKAELPGGEQQICQATVQLQIKQVLLLN